MQAIAIGDVLFVLLVLGLIHGILSLLTLVRKRSSRVTNIPTD